MIDKISVAMIGLIGVLLSAVVQWLIAHFTVRAETDRLHRKILKEFDLQQLSEWQLEFRKIITDLLVFIDPEIYPVPDKKRIVPLVLQAQFMLNPNLPSHGKVNSLINKLALMVNGWHVDLDDAVILRLHGQLLEASRDLIYRPMIK